MRTSKLEERIINVFLREHIGFIREYRFKDLKGGRYRFDFYVPAFNILVEVDGEQHFKFVKKFHKTRADFLKQQGRDRAKNAFCLAHKIRLYRVPYWEVENISCYGDITQKKFLVKNRYHNDLLKH